MSPDRKYFDRAPADQMANLPLVFAGETEEERIEKAVSWLKDTKITNGDGPWADYRNRHWVPREVLRIGGGIFLVGVAAVGVAIGYGRLQKEGDTVAFVSCEEGGVVLRDMSSGSEVMLVEGMGKVCPRSNFEADGDGGGELLIHDGHRSMVYEIADGKAVKLLEAGIFSWEGGDFDVSKSGWLAYVYSGGGTPMIRAVEPGGKEVDLVKDGVMPRWSESGKLAFLRSDGNGLDLFVAVGGDEIRLTDSLSVSEYGWVSGDGLVVVDNSGGDGAKIVGVDSETGGKEVLIDGLVGCVGNPMVSEDGRKLAFSRKVVDGEFLVVFDLEEEQTMFEVEIKGGIESLAFVGDEVRGVGASGYYVGSKEIGRDIFSVDSEGVVDVMGMVPSADVSWWEG